MNIDDIDTLARTIWGEARGESREGKIAVAWVVRNRAERPGWWGTGIYSVCRRPYQFSCWNQNDPNFPKLISVNLDRPSFLRCYAVAAGVLADFYPDPTQGSTHYAVVGLNPSWARGKVPVVTIGRHEFWNDVE